MGADTHKSALTPEILSSASQKVKIFSDLATDYVEYLSSLGIESPEDHKLGALQECVGRTEEEQKHYLDYATFLKDSTRYIDELTSWHLDQISMFKSQVAHLLDKGNPGVVLDYGSGIGSRAATYAIAGWTSYLVELTTLSQEFAKWRFKKYGLTNATFSSTVKLPEWKNTCDEILLIDTIGHLPDPEKSIQEISECAKSGALLHITWDDWSYTFEGGVHRNKEFDFEESLNRNQFHLKDENNKNLWIKE
jgi:SAM-dependent methyltransferase